MNKKWSVTLESLQGLVERVSQRADKTSSPVRNRLEAQLGCQVPTCQEPLLMRGISLDPANIFRINLLVQGGSLDWCVFDIVETV